MNAPSFRIELEHVRTESFQYTFRVAFHACAERMLLPYPEEHGLRFTDKADVLLAEWGTTTLIAGEPRNEFILMPEVARIAFDLIAPINPPADDDHRWTLKLPAGEARVAFHFEVRPDLERYEALAKLSRSASRNKPWGGLIVSNAIDVMVGPATPPRRLSER
jgi:hypothetical protein